MLLRPYTITAVAAIIHIFWLVFFLMYVVGCEQREDRPTSRALAATFFMFGLLAIHNVFLTLSDHLLVDSTRVLRSVEVIGIMYFGCRFLYGLLHELTDDFLVEESWFQRGFIWLGIIELLIASTRLLPTWGNAVPEQRPLYLELPLLLSQLWLITLAFRAWFYAGRRTERDKKGSAFRWFALMMPIDASTRMMRNIAVAIVMSLLYTVSFVLLGAFDTPLWTNSLADPAAVSILLIITFSYLRYRSHNVGMELKIVSAALVIFLSLTATLGWLITVVFVQMEQPTVALESIVGSLVAVDFVVSESYRPIAERLHMLLLPVFWFQLLGSLLFIIGYRLYYRLQINSTIVEILHGIERIEHGHLDYRIPVASQDELGTIGAAFNGMAGSLQDANQALVTYQAGLETTIAERTAQLQTEIEQRKAKELVDAIANERARIAREAHDGILQSLLMIRMKLRSRSLRRLQPAALNSALDELATLVLDTSRELRQIISDNQVAMLHATMSDALSIITKRFEDAYAISTQLILPKQPLELELPEQLGILRIVQEALSNIGRHSGATVAQINVAQSAETLHVTITDNGVGFDPTHQMTGGYGLDSMRSRAENLGGTLTIAPSSTGGAVVTVILPHILESSTDRE